MKKVLLGVLAILSIASLVACGNKNETVPSNTDVEVTPIVSNEEPEELEIEEEEEEIPEDLDEEVGVGNTDEGMVALVLEDHYTSNYPDAVEEVIPTNIKVYTEEEIASDELLKDYTINEGDIVFDAEYDLKLFDDYSGDKMMFTAATGEIDGQYIRSKSNVGIARSGDSGYTLDAFGTAF